jgi:lipid-binding SYLF domain-containing protein
MSRVVPAALAFVLCFVFLSPAIRATEAKDNELDARRRAIETMALETMERLFEEAPASRALYDRAAGFAVFDTFKVSVLLSGGGGVGVAVDRQAKRHTYMKSGTGGVGLGLGGHSYQQVLLFETQELLDRFVDSGWQVDAGASAAVGSAGKGATATFTRGVAVFQLTNKGVIAGADVTGTRYWRSRALNGD